MNREYMLATYVYQTLKRFDEDAYCNSETFYGRGRLTEGCLMADWLPTYCNGVYRIKWGTQYVTQCRYMNLMLFGCSYGLDVDIDKFKKKEEVFGWLKIIYLLIILVLCTAYLIDASFNPFLYFRF